MNKFILIFALVPCSCFAASQRVHLDMLNSQIAMLEQQRTEKYAELKKCESETKNFKIAGISTLAATGVGIYANVALHKKLSNLSNGTSGGSVTVVRSKSDEQRQDAELCKIDPVLCA